jgi:ribulose-phosphate 3-epimerase
MKLDKEKRAEKALLKGKGKKRPFSRMSWSIYYYGWGCVVLCKLLLPASGNVGVRQSSWFTIGTSDNIRGGGNEKNKGEPVDSPLNTDEIYSNDTPQKYLVLGIDGGTESLRACLFDGRTGQRVGQACAVPYTTTHPHPGWAEQDPTDWYRALCQAIQGALQSAPVKDAAEAVAALCMDTTCCSVVALKADGEPLRPALLWMDQRAAKQTQQIVQDAAGDPALSLHGGKTLSAEWLTGKALWLRQNEFDTVWQHATTIGEYQDYLNFRLTGRMVASACNAAVRWHWRVDEAVCTTQDTEINRHPGRPMSLYEKIGLTELADKLPQICLPMGATIGGLTPQASADLGLPPNVPLIQGGPDAFVGMVGLGCLTPGQLCLITGSSHLLCAVIDNDASAAPAGLWGPYHDAPLPGIAFCEGGQSSTGSLLRWARALLRSSSNSSSSTSSNATLSYAEWDAEAALIAPGADGLLAIETFQGARTPVTDPLAKGALVGLTLSHRPAHIWRALLEAVCLGTRASVQALQESGHACTEIVLAGGSTHSPLWLQLHADVTGVPVVVCENTDAPLLGCAILAAVGVGLQPSVEVAVQKMVRVAKRIEPDPVAHAQYTQLYEQAYQPTVTKVRKISHALHAFHGGSQDNEASSEHSYSKVTISPSLLACDWGKMRQEVQRCWEAGAHRLHVDVFDGVFLQSPEAFTFGPDMVKVIYDSVRSLSQSQSSPSSPDKPWLDLHMCVQNPSRFVPVLAQVAPGQTFVFQWEAVPTISEATALIESIAEYGMQCGISINPSTPVDVILPLLDTGLVSVVDILAVEPGFGGQTMQPSVLHKVARLRQWLDSRSNLANIVSIMVDGGVNTETAGAIKQAGADILVSGSFLFCQDIARGMQSLLQSVHIDRVTKDPSCSQESSLGTSPLMKNSLVALLLRLLATPPGTTLLPKAHRSSRSFGPQHHGQSVWRGQNLLMGGSFSTLHANIPTKLAARRNKVDDMSAPVGRTRTGGRKMIFVGALLALASLAGMAKIGVLPEPLLTPAKGYIPYSDSYILQDIGATLLTGMLGYLFVEAVTMAADLQWLEPRDSRKIIHTLSAPLFMLFWPVFSPATGSQCFAALVPMINAVRLFKAATDESEMSLRQAISRSGEAREALGGPFIYVVLLATEILCFWRGSPAGLVALATLAAGDGLADLVGRRWGKSNPWQPGYPKSIAGSLAFCGAAWGASAGILAWMQYWDCLSAFDVGNVGVRLAVVTLAAAIMELLPVADDNYTVPLSAGIGAFLLLPVVSG